MNSTSEEFSKLFEMIENLNQRLNNIEANINLSKSYEQGNDVAETILEAKESSEDMEFRLGEKWFGKIGIIAFLLAALNFLILPFEGFPQPLILIVGFMISGALIIASTFGERLLKNLTGYTLGSGLILLFVSILRLHFFSKEPFMSESFLMIFLLYMVSILSLVISIKRQTPYLATLSFTFFYLAAIISDYPVLIFITLILGAAGVSILNKKYNWNPLSIFVIILTYLIHLIWYLNNPLIGKELMVTQSWNLNLLVIPVYMLIFGMFGANNVSEDVDDFYAIQKTTFNSIGGFGLFVFISLNSNYNLAGPFNFALSIILLVIASTYWTKQKSKFSTFLYSMLAYAALSTAIILTFSFPGYFIWLCWQSIAVVSTALWFRSKFIVVANLFIFLAILIAYFSSTNFIAFSSISFGIVALISARIMNWQKERLELKTDNLRTAYLAVAFVVIPLILYFNLPSQFVGISYIGLAFLYYIIGKLISNKKYRLMASGTLILSLVYIFIFGILSAETTYKIFSFLLVSISLIIISVVYARERVKQKQA